MNVGDRVRYSDYALEKAESPERLKLAKSKYGRVAAVGGSDGLILIEWDDGAVLRYTKRMVVKLTDLELLAEAGE